MELSYSLFLAIGYFLIAILSKGPVGVLSKTVQQLSSAVIGEGSPAAAIPPPPELIRLRDVARNALLSGILFGGVFLLAHFRKWDVHWFFLTVGTLYALTTLAGTLGVRRLALRAQAGEVERKGESSPTPFDGIDLLCEKGEKPFDVFISYKSEDVHVVRQIADLLLASGLKVWFAEYLILLSEKYRQEEAEGADTAIQGALDRGIRSSRRGVLFTNDRYVGSHWCRQELDALLGPEGPGLENLIEVMIPSEPGTRERYPQLSTCPAMRFEGDLARTYQGLAHFLGSPPAPIPSGDSGPRRWHRDPRAGYSLDVTGWEVTDPGGGKIFGGIQGPRLERSLGGIRVKGNLSIGPAAERPRPIPGPGLTQDDREALRLSFSRAKGFADRYLTHSGDQCAGAHVLFYGGFSHLVLTYRKAGLWMRRYSVVVPHHRTSEGTEYAFVFGFEGPFTELCRHASELDALVLSLSLGGGG
ncbi:MAG: toll/interleukin-1 receptor domain-containing protein [Gemmatimonadota bacterium]